MLEALRKLHRWLGLLLLVPLFVLGLTGTVLVLEPGSRGADSARLPVSADAVVAAARVAVSEGMIPVRYVPTTTDGVAEVWFAPASGPRGRGMLIVPVDPETQRPAGPVRSQDGLLAWSHRLHANFLLPNETGRSIVGWTGVGMVVLCAMGVPIWWPPRRRWAAGFTFSLTAKGYRFHRELHGAAGIWTLALLLVFGATGAVLGFPRTARDMLGVPADAVRRAAAPRAMPQGVSPSTGAPARTPALDAALLLAQGAAPEGVTRIVFPPNAPGAPFRVMLSPPGADSASSMTTVTVDGLGTRVLNVRSPAAMAPGERALRLMRDLHAGAGLGVVWRGLAVIAGLLSPLFAITGAAMWITRNRDKRRIAASRSVSVSVAE